MTAFVNVRKYLQSQDVQVLEFDAETPTAETAAEAVGCSPAEIAKSILFMVGGEPVLVVTSGDMKVNSSRLKGVSGLRGKVKFPDADEVKRHTGYSPGGVCPFLLPRGLAIYLDSSLQRFEIVYPAAGNDHSAARVDCRTLEALTGGSWGDLSVPLATR